MALLTAEDVLNKAFSKTKYREGFDQDEVDDFLDEVVVELRRLNQEAPDKLIHIAFERGVALDGLTEGIDPNMQKFAVHLDHRIRVGNATAEETVDARKPLVADDGNLNRSPFAGVDRERNQPAERKHELVDLATNVMQRGTAGMLDRHGTIYE